LILTVKDKKNISIYEFSLEEIENNLDRFFEDIELSFFSFKKFNKFQTENGYKLIARCQYTGSEDINDKEIYEGDIVTDKYKNIYEIRYEPEWMSFALVNDNECVKKHLIFDTEEYYSAEEIKVIGNIFKNKNLLKNKGDKNE